MDSKDEINRSISHLFDKNNEWIGYEYEVIIDQHHTRIEIHDNGGRLVSVKHRFNNPPNDGSLQDFVDFMEMTKSKASQNYSGYLADMKKKPIDLSSSIATAKLWREAQKFLRT